MNRLISFKWSLLLSSVLSLAQGSAFAASPDESPLDSLIPPQVRAQIDLRKSKVGLLENHARAFAGSRSVDLSFRDTAVKQQFPAKKCVGLFHTKVGTCSAFGLAAAVENAMGDHIDLSERHLWNQYCTPSSSAALDAITKGQGVIESSYWPGNYVTAPGNYAQATRYKVFEFHPLEDNIPAMLAALDRGSPLYFAINTPSEMYARKPVVSAASGSTGGGHAIAIVGYKLDDTVEGGGYFLVKNSWGVSNGNHGYQWLSMGYCGRSGNYCSAWSIDRAGKN